MWRTSHWVEVDERSVRALLYRFTENATYETEKNPKPWAPNRRKIGDVLDALAAICILSTDVNQPSWLYDEHSGKSTIVAVANGLLEVERKRLFPHTPDFFNQTSVPFNYDPAAAQPTKWLQFLGELWSDEPAAIEVLGQWFGYVISGQQTYTRSS
jgi:putative DNA primase/helicase